MSVVKRIVLSSCLLMASALTTIVQAQTCADLDGSYVFSNDGTSTYLGFFGSQYATESIMNQYGTYGSPYSTNGVRNEFSTYGSAFSNYSANNEFANSPPIIFKYGVARYYLTTNAFLAGGVSLSAIDSSCTFYATAPLTVAPPLAPAAISVADGTDPELLAVAWTAVSGATGYRVYQSSTNSNGNYVLLGTTPNTSTVISGLEQGITYYIAVSAYNSGGESAAIYDTGYLATSYTVTPSAGAGGSISPSTSQEVTENNTVAFELSASSGYEIDAVGGTCEGALSGSTFTTSPITSDCTVTASFSELPSYTVTPSAGSNGSISPSNAQTVTSGSASSFTIEASSGYEIDSVGGTCGGSLSGSTYTTNSVTADCSVIASFAPITYSVTPSAGENGSISPSSAQSIGSGGAVTFTVSPDSGYQVASVGGSCGGSLSGSTYTTNAVTADCSVEASFSQITHLVTPSAGSNGSISPSAEQLVAEGDTITFTLTADSGYVVAAVGGTCGGSLSGSSYTTDVISGACTVEATFSEIVGAAYAVSPSAGANGSIDPSTPVTVAEGATTAFALTADSGYEIDQVSGTCGGSLSGSTYVTEAITSDCTVTVTYSELPSYVVTPSAGVNGSVSPDTPQSVLSGSTATFTISADTGYNIAAVSGSCGGSLSGSTYTTNAIISDCTVSVTFSESTPQSCDTFGTSGAYVQKIFIAYLGRPAAPAGLEYFANYMDTNNEQGKLILFDDLYYSAEAEALYSTSTLSEQINQFYQFMFSRDALSGGLNYWIDQINGGYFTIPASAAYIADAAAGEDMAVLDAKQVAASKLTCAIGDDASKLSAFQANLAGARASIAAITTAEQAEAYDGDAELASIIGSARATPNTWSREASGARGTDEDAKPIPTLPMLGFFILSGLMILLGLRRLKAAV
ncbi:hypothetical protein PQZ11_01550 [Luminiphilus sp.]|nr:hypothetical protein [Luminiphilus sp.]